MKAAVCRDFSQPLSIEEIELAAPNSGEVKVTIHACAICHSDVIYMDGGWGGNLPIVLGHEAAGIVEEVGINVDNVKPGDAVLVTLIRSCGHCYCCQRGKYSLCESRFDLDDNSPLTDRQGNLIGQGLRTAAFAEQVVVEQSQVVKIPDSMPMDSASLLSCGVITGLGAVTNTTKVMPGQSVAVIGCGGVGLNSIQGARLKAADPIIGIDLVDEKLANAKLFGATTTINPLKQNTCQIIADLTNGRGVEFVFMTAGSSKAIEQGIEILARDGTIVLVGMPANGDHPDIDATMIANEGKKIIGSKMGFANLPKDIPQLIELYEKGDLLLDELITNRYSLQDINLAIDEVRADKALRNVIVFK